MCIDDRAIQTKLFKTTNKQRGFRTASNARQCGPLANASERSAVHHTVHSALRKQVARGYGAAAVGLPVAGPRLFCRPFRVYACMCMWLGTP